jgi:hypothetical protein
MKFIRNYDLSDIEKLKELGAKVKIEVKEATTLPAGGTITLFEGIGTGILRKFMIFIDGASYESSYTAFVRITIDGEVIYENRLALLFMYYANTGRGTKDGYCTYRDDTAYQYAFIRYLDYPFFNGFKIEVINKDAANASSVDATLESLRFKNL